MIEMDIESKKSHWARHMERIALLSLPREGFEDTRSVNWSIVSLDRSSRNDGLSVNGWSSRSSSSSGNNQGRSADDDQRAPKKPDDLVDTSDREDDLLFISQGK